MGYPSYDRQLTLITSKLCLWDCINHHPWQLSTNALLVSWYHKMLQHCRLKKYTYTYIYQTGRLPFYTPCTGKNSVIYLATLFFYCGSPDSLTMFTIFFMGWRGNSIWNISNFACLVDKRKVYAKISGNKHYKDQCE